MTHNQIQQTNKSNKETDLLTDFLIPLAKKKSRGQLSIFLAMCVLSIITMLAFVVNVGLYVKARINLQNAVDSAAYAGAASQARMLTNIAYLNWEMHNTYKEWMMKYYVLGNLSMSHARPNGYGWKRQPGQVIFRQRKLMGGNVNESEAYDRYNAASICIHFGSDNNICEIAKVPGIPRFEPVGIPGVSEKQEIFLDQIASTKAQDCSDRSALNWGVAAIWAYGTGDSAALTGFPAVASDRMGAWVQALELGMRIRNLELMMNRPPVKNPICEESGCTSINDLTGEYPNFPFNERPVKAYLSAYKNLGGDNSSNSGGEGIIKSTFKLFELAPTPFSAGKETLSGFLTKGGQYLSGEQWSDKHYLDLQLIPLNLATFFTSFVTTPGSVTAGVKSDAACQATKTALPVPGYLFGFVKNPDVVTYYAVKGEAKYVGLLNPFKDAQITIKAYAAAMPFGGRIGPRFFDIDTSNQSVKPRKGRPLSVPFLSGLATSGKFEIGFPIPSSDKFWVTLPDDTIGGVPFGNAIAKFAIPNMFYDVNSGETLDKYQTDHFSGTPIRVLQSGKPQAAQVELYAAPTDKWGLFDAAQYELIFSFLGTFSQSIDSVAINKALDMVRGATYFDANNYMIPMVDPKVSESTESSGMIRNVQELDPVNSPGVYSYLIYAPLFGDNLYFKDAIPIGDVARDFLQKIGGPALATFQTGLEEVANVIASAGKTAEAAAKSIYNGIAMPANATPDSNSPPCKDLALSQKFNYYLSGKENLPLCGITPVHIAVMNFFDKKFTTGDSTYANYYHGSYYARPDIKALNLMTAYFPSKRQGAEGEVASASNPHPLGLGDDPAPISKRNFYSVKFVNMANALSGDTQASIHRKVFYEKGGTDDEMSTEGITSTFANGLNKADLAEFGTDLYF